MLQSYLSGTVEVTASDGEAQRLGPGSLLLLEDTHGRRHSTRVLGDVVMLVAQLRWHRTRRRPRQYGLAGTSAESVRCSLRRARW